MHRAVDDVPMPEDPPVILPVTPAEALVSRALNNIDCAAFTVSVHGVQTPSQRAILHKLAAKLEALANR